MGSWLCPVVSWGMQAFLNMMMKWNLAAPRADGFYLLALVQGGLLIAGLVMGIRALKGTKVHGSKGIRIPAIIGLVVSSVTFILIAALALMLLWSTSSSSHSVFDK